MADGRVVTGEKAVADAHPNGAHPWAWPDYLQKFGTLCADRLAPDRRQAFLAAAQAFATLESGGLDRLLPALPEGAVTPDRPTGQGIFDHGLE
jgi:2-methylcitrate dehydratase